MSVSKIVAAAASGVGGAGLDVDEVFNTHLYTGTGSAIPVNNGIDMSGEGGLVWIKGRNTTRSHYLYDTVRGTTKALVSSQTNAQFDISNAVTAFNNNGYTIGTYDDVNSSDANKTQVAWAFRKAPKFFDVVTFTGDGNEPSAWISHSLGQIPGMIIIKRTDSTSNWFTWHKGLSGRYDSLYLNLTNSSTSLFTFDNTTNGITDTQFRVNFGGSNIENISGATYVAYLFAHHNNDGGFGPDGDQDIIKCGSYTGNNSTNGPTINLGFEPQWLLLRHLDANGNSWLILDNMRGVSTGGNDAYLRPNASGDEQSSADLVEFNSTGFQLKRANDDVNGNGNSYIYMAIRRGPLAAPTDATKVFAPIAYTTTDGSWQDRILQSNFTTDLAINGYRNISDGGTHTFVDRLRGYGTILRSHQTSAESDRSGDYHPWPQTGQSVTSNEWSKYNSGNGLDYYNYQWKRARGYFDVVCWDGLLGASNFSGTTSINHNLGVTPEMIWVKSRSNTPKWCVGSTHFSSGGTLALNETAALEGVGNTYNFVYADWSSTVFKVGSNDEVNRYGYTYIAYLFATVPGVSKISSVVHSGTTNVDAGFSNGSRFVLLKRTDATGDWLIWDGTRGIVSGNDPYLALNSTAAEVTNTDYIDPLSSGFTLTSNLTAGTYIYYAIA